MTTEQMLEALKDSFPDIMIKETDIAGIVFEERVKMNCFYCGKYKNNWKCPPNIPEIDYPKMFSEFEHAAFVWLRAPFGEQNFGDVRRDSSLTLHKALLKLEKELWNRGYPTALSFIGGSCKLCKNGCGEGKCNNPYEARTPLEAVGVNVVKSAEYCGIQIHFPPEQYLTRIGLVLW